MSITLGSTQLPALARGYALYGSGGGGHTYLLELAAKRAEVWPVTLHDVEDLDPASACLGAALVGSPILLQERLLEPEPFGPLIDAIERWAGTRVPVICSLEGGGFNGLVPLAMTRDRLLVDADLTGRALTNLDQMSLLVEKVPGMVIACDTGAGGVAIIESDRAVDIERTVRAAIVQAGGIGGMVLAGFTVGDLRENSIVGHAARALRLGEAFLAAELAPLSELAEAIDGRLLGTGRVTAMGADPTDLHVKSFAIDGARGEVHRLVTRSENLAFMTDGQLLAAAPTVIVVLDAASHQILQVSDVTVGRHVAVIGLAGPAWWYERPQRLREVVPSAYGLVELDCVT